MSRLTRGEPDRPAAWSMDLLTQLWEQLRWCWCSWR